MTCYIITATLNHHTTDARGVAVTLTKQIPTFFLYANMQGIVDEKHAEQIAREIICPIELQHESVTIHITATEM